MGSQDSSSEPIFITRTVNDNSRLISYATGGVIFLILVYSMKEYLVLGLVGAGAIYIYKLVDDSNHGNRRR